VTAALEQLDLAAVRIRQKPKTSREVVASPELM
jgi:hypothetical protein